jgi:hypothetical protein
MRFHRLLSALCVLSTTSMTACGADTTPDAELGSVAMPVAIQKSFTRKLYVHLMPWFQVGGLHWSMNSRNSATGLASWYVPMIGEYNSNDSHVIEYQLLMMKYSGIDGVLVDWPGLDGAYDRPQNKANADAFIQKTAAFGLEFAVCYEDQYAASLDAAKNDMAYVRDQFFSKPNHIKLNGAPALLVFGPQKFRTEVEWNNILSVFPTNPAFFPLFYNDFAGSNADGKFAWVGENGIKGVADFNNGADRTDHGAKIPVIYPGFNPYYAQGGWPGPTFKISYTLKPDGSEGGNTLQSTFELGRDTGEAIQNATWNDYGEGTMIEPTNQFQYQFLTALQRSVGAIYTEAELKIVKMLYDQRKSGKNAAMLDQASAALANLDVAKACTILGCTAPVHTGSGGSTGTGGATGSGGSTASGGTKAGSGGSTTGSGGTNPGTGGGNPAAGRPNIGGAENTTPAETSDGSCSCSAVGAERTNSSALFVTIVSALALIPSRLKRRRNAKHA